MLNNHVAQATLVTIIKHPFGVYAVGVIRPIATGSVSAKHSTWISNMKLVFTFGGLLSPFTLF